MNARNIVFAILLSAIFLSSSAFSETAPSNAQIQEWWKATPNEQMIINGAPMKITLRSKEVAYLAHVTFLSRGRNFMSQTVMIRPAMKQVREVGDPVKQDCSVHDLDRDGISEVETVTMGSGQGYTEGMMSIVQFDGWKPVVLHQVKFSDNSGCCGAGDSLCGQCEAVEVSWQFKDLDNDGKDDLVEEIVTKKGPSQEKMQGVGTTNKYLFRNKVFTKIK